MVAPLILNSPGIRWSSRHPVAPPSRMEVDSSTCSTASSGASPVLTAPLCAAIHRDSTSGKNRLKPTMYRLRELFRSTYCNAERPTGTRQFA